MAEIGIDQVLYETGRLHMLLADRDRVIAELQRALVAVQGERDGLKQELNAAYGKTPEPASEPTPISRARSARGKAPEPEA